MKKFKKDIVCLYFFAYWDGCEEDTVCQDLPMSQREVSFRGLRDTKGCEGIYLQESAYVPDRACHGKWRGDLSLQRE